MAKEQIPKDRCSWRRAQEGSLVAMAPDCLILLGEQRSCGRRVNPHHCTLLFRACIAQQVHVWSLTPSLSLGCSADNLAWDIRNPPDTASSRISPALQQPCQGKMQHSTKDYGIAAFAESATGILLDLIQHHGFVPSSLFIMLCQDWSRPCSLPAAETTRCNPKNVRKASCCLTPTTLWHNLSQSLQSLMPSAAPTDNQIKGDKLHAEVPERKIKFQT